jgi:hypothetical protein
MASLIGPNNEFLGNCPEEYITAPGETLTLFDPPNGMSDPQWNETLQQWWAGEPPIEAVTPNLTGFRLGMMGSPAFQAWELTLPGPKRENLKLAAMAGKLAEMQVIYNQLLLDYLPPPEARDEWQALANQCNVPMVF